MSNYFKQRDGSLILLDVLSDKNGEVIFVESEDDFIFISAEDFLNSIRHFLANSDVGIWGCEEPYSDWLAEKYPKKQRRHGEISDNQIKDLVDDWNENAEENEVPEMTYAEVREFFDGWR